MCAKQVKVANSFTGARIVFFSKAVMPPLVTICALLVLLLLLLPLQLLPNSPDVILCG